MLHNTAAKRREKRVKAFLYLAVGLFFFVLSAPVVADSADILGENADGRVKYLVDCFKDKISAVRARGGIYMDLNPTAMSQASLFDAVKNHIDEFRSATDVPTLSDFCQKRLVKPYVDAFVKTYSKHQKKIPDWDLAKLGGMTIESDSFFLDFFHNSIGRHDSGHSDITLKALEGLAGNFPFMNGVDGPKHAVRMLMKASQAPDLHRWNHETYHAHTPDYRTAADRSAMMSIGQKEFEKLIDQRVDDICYSAKNPANTRRALLHLGMLFHIVQDLIYHRGMTLAQHAGLAYLPNDGFCERTDGKKCDPDLPPGVYKDGFPVSGLARDRFMEAVSATQLVINAVAKIIPPSGWSRMMEWKDRFANYSFLEFARMELGDPDIGLGALLDYWALKFDYEKDATGAQKRSLYELRPPSLGGYVAVWDVSGIVQKIDMQIRARKCST